jgi:hypothetical protein
VVVWSEKSGTRNRDRIVCDTHGGGGGARPRVPLGGRRCGRGGLDSESQWLESAAHRNESYGGGGGGPGGDGGGKAGDDDCGTHFD